MRTAEFEADALIKGQFHDRKSSLIFSTDSDIPTDLGDRCLVVNVFTGRRLRVATTSRSTRETAFKGLGVESQQCVKRHEPKYPLYQGVGCMKMRALMSVILGCDICPGGVIGVGGKKL